MTTPHPDVTFGWVQQCSSAAVRQCSSAAATTGAASTATTYDYMLYSLLPCIAHNKVIRMYEH